MHAENANHLDQRQDMLHELHRVQQDLQSIQARLAIVEEHLTKHAPDTTIHQHRLNDLLALQAARRDLSAQAAFLEELLHSHLID